MIQTRETGHPFLLLLFAFALLGCAGGRSSFDVQAVPAREGAVQLRWRGIATSPESPVSYEVQSLASSGEWTTVARLDAVASGSMTWDGALAASPRREPRSYRVVALRGGRRASTSETVRVVPVFRGLPLFGWVDASAPHSCRIRGVDRPSSLQCAIESLGGHTGPDEDPAVGPHVLYFPPGTYDVERTLWLEGRAGVQFVGAGDGASVVRWRGPRGSGPESASVLFHSEGNRDSAWRALVWDGGCSDPAACFVVAFDQSFCGREDLPILRSRTCGAARLGWPEDPTLGESDNGGAHIDEEFRNAWIGLRVGHHGVADDTSTLRRCSFRGNFAGVSLEDFNALRHWFWDPLFSENEVGVTNHLTALQFPDDPALRGRFWAGDFSITRGRFERNAHTDVWAEPTGEISVRDSVSRGSGRFFYAAGPNTTPGRFSLIGNDVRTTRAPAIESRTPGPLLLLDNRIGADGAAGAAAVVVDGMAGEARSSDGLGSTDLVAQGNRFDAAIRGPYEFRVPGRHRVADDPPVADGADVGAVPPMPEVVDPLARRPVFTVVDADTDDASLNAARIQRILDAAGSGGHPAVVHLPGLRGRYRVDRTLTVPSGSDLVLTGDGAWTTVEWVGASGVPLLRVDASDLRRLVIRDLQFRGAGVVVGGLDESAGDVLVSRLRVAEAGVAGVSLDGVDVASVDIMELQANGGLIAGGEGVGVRDLGSRVVERSTEGGRAGRLALWSGITLRNRWDFDFEGPGERLIAGHYMERSRRHLRARGGAGTVEIHGSKIAPLYEATRVPSSDLLEDVTASILLEEYDGRLSLALSQFFLIPTETAGPGGAAALAHGARIRVDGGHAEVGSVGITVRRPPDSDRPAPPEFTLSGPASTYRRIAGKEAVPGAFPLPDGLFGPGGGADEPSVAVGVDDRVSIERHVRLIRDWDPPGFYDEAADDGRHRIVFDKLFIMRPPGVGLLLVGSDAPVSGATPRR